MIHSIVEAIKKAALMHKAVLTFKYQDRILINAQPNNSYYQVIVETDGYLRQLGDKHSLSLNMDILGFVKDDNELEVQDIAGQIGLSIINKAIDDNRQLMALQDYSMLFFTKNTDDSAAGVRITLNLVVPSFIDYCTEDDNFLSDEEYSEKLENMKDWELNLGEPVPDIELDLKPADLH